MPLVLALATKWATGGKSYNNRNECSFLRIRRLQTQIPGYEAGVYGSYEVIEEMAKRGACRHFWQTYAWSRGQKSSRANLYQYRNNVKVAGGTNEKMSSDDAVKIIAFLQAAWKVATTKTDKEEFHRLANEVRKAAGLPLT